MYWLNVTQRVLLEELQNSQKWGNMNAGMDSNSFINLQGPAKSSNASAVRALIATPEMSNFKKLLPNNTKRLYYLPHGLSSFRLVALFTNDVVQLPLPALLHCNIMIYTVHGRTK